MSNTETPIGLFVDAATGESTVRELTTDEIAALKEAPVVDDLVEGEQPQIDDIESDVDDVVES